MRDILNDEDRFFFFFTLDDPVCSERIKNQPAEWWFMHYFMHSIEINQKIWWAHNRKLWKCQYHLWPPRLVESMGEKRQTDRKKSAQCKYFVCESTKSVWKNRRTEN